MFALCCILLTFPTIEAKSFSNEQQKQLLEATVQIHNRDRGALGTGVLVAIRDGKGYLLSAMHVVGKYDSLEISFFSELSYPKPATRIQTNRILLKNPEADLALIEVDLKAIETPPRPILIAAVAPKGKSIAGLTSGCSNGSSPTLEMVEIQGRKLVQRPDETSAFFWQTRQAPRGGRSGGALVDTEGNLLGICSGTQKELGYYSHLDEIRSWLKKSDHAGLLEADPKVKNR